MLDSQVLILAQRMGLEGNSGDRWDWFCWVWNETLRFPFHNMGWSDPAGFCWGCALLPPLPILGHTLLTLILDQFWHSSDTSLDGSNSLAWFPSVRQVESARWRGRRMPEAAQGGDEEGCVVGSGEAEGEPTLLALSGCSWSQSPRGKEWGTAPSGWTWLR